MTKEERKIYDTNYRIKHKDKINKSARDRPKRKRNKNKNIKKYQYDQKEYSKKWRKENKDKVKHYNDKNYLNQYMGKNNTLKYKYGITYEDYNILFKKQKGNCDICKTHQSELKRKLCIDHDHKTGKVRGLLCHHCNSVLGYAKDQINILNKAILYLKNQIS